MEIFRFGLLKRKKKHQNQHSKREKQQFQQGSLRDLWLVSGIPFTFLLFIHLFLFCSDCVSHHHLCWCVKFHVFSTQRKCDHESKKKTFQNSFFFLSSFSHVVEPQTKQCSECMSVVVVCYMGLTFCGFTFCLLRKLDVKSHWGIQFQAEMFFPFSRWLTFCGWLSTTNIRKSLKVNKRMKLFKFIIVLIRWFRCAS